MGSRRTPRQVYEDEILEMPAGLDRAILRIMGFHVGKDQAIDKPELLAQLGKMGFHVGERVARKVIVDLRKRGKLICSSSGESGYFIAATPEEYAEFAQVEYRAKIVDMSETLRAMDDGAKAIFHGTPEQAKQVGLF